MILAGAVVFDVDAEVGSGPLVTFAEGPADKLELAEVDGSPVGRIGGAVVLADAVVLGPEVAGAVSFAALVTFAGGDAEAVALADVAAVPLSEGLGEAVGAVALPVKGGAVPFKDVGTAPVSEGLGEGGGAVPLAAEDEGAIPDVVVSLPENGVGAVVLPGAGAVVFVGSGSAKVVEFSDTIMLVAVDSVPLVGTGEDGEVEAGTDTVALLGAIPEDGGGELTPVPDGGSAEAVPLSVGKGGDVVEDPGSGGKDVSPDGRGAKTVLEFAMMIRLVAAADPLMLMVVTPVIAPTDEVSLIGTEAEDSMLEGGGATTVVGPAGTTTLVTGAVPLVMMVVRLPVITPGGVNSGGAVVPEPVGNGAMTVVELRGTMTLLAAAVPLTKTVETLPGISLGPAVLFANGGEDGIGGALGDNDGGGGGSVTVVTEGPGEGPERG